MLTEDDIKRIFPAFLRRFYLHRYDYLPGTEEISLDNTSAEGLVADGQLAFDTPEGHRFVATFEATSADKAEEVKYRLNTRYFLWDCLAFGAVFAAFAYAVAYYRAFEWLVQLGWEGNLGYLLGMGLVGFLGWYFGLRGWRKYRYIYAIEQFKQYYADEQWIALADDVFFAPTDPYLMELKNQCIYHGFGLALVSADEAVRVVVAPSRLGVYGKDRRMVDWIARRDWFKAVAQNITVVAQYRPKVPSLLDRTWNKTTRPVRYLVLEPVSGALRRAGMQSQRLAGQTWERFMGSQPIQKWVFVFSLAFVAALGYPVITHREERIEEIVDLSAGNPENQYGYLYEGEEEPHPRGIPKQYPSHSPVATVSAPTLEPVAPTRQEDIPTIDLTGIEDEPDPVQQPCYPYRSLSGWIIRESTFANRELAERRVAELKKANIDGEVIPEECFEIGRGYMVRIGRTHTSEAAAKEQIRQLSRRLESRGVYGADLRPMKVP